MPLPFYCSIRTRYIGAAGGWNRATVNAFTLAGCRMPYSGGPFGTPLLTPDAAGGCLVPHHLPVTCLLQSLTDITMASQSGSSVEVGLGASLGDSGYVEVPIALVPHRLPLPLVHSAWEHRYLEVCVRDTIRCHSIHSSSGRRPFVPLFSCLVPLFPGPLFLEGSDANIPYITPAPLEVGNFLHTLLLPTCRRFTTAYPFPLLYQLGATYSQILDAHNLTNLLLHVLGCHSAVITLPPPHLL